VKYLVRIRITFEYCSTEPNIQNIPIRSENGRLVRKAFIPAEGNVLLSADYSQIDLRVLAHMSGDANLVKAFKAGGDIHTATAADVFHVKPEDVTTDMRRNAKAINFGIVYGQQAYGLSQTLGIPQKEAQEFINRYLERYSGVKEWIEATLAEARKTGQVRTISGRLRKVPEISSTNQSIRGFAERVAMNTPIQGSSADIIKVAMVSLWDAMKEKNLKAKMIIQVHDELLFDVPEAELSTMIDLARRHMEGAYQLKVPVVVDMKKGKNWNDMEKLKLEKAAR
jgi:DNA polymerase-1